MHDALADEPTKMRSKLGRALLDDLARGGDLDLIEQAVHLFAEDELDVACDEDHVAARRAGYQARRHVFLRPNVRAEAPGADG